MEPTPKIPDLLVWVDLETTGLEAERESILEIACIVTDSALQPIATFCAITNAARYHAIALLDPVVQAMHTRSGLWDASMSAPRGQAQVAAEFRDFLDAHLPTVEVDGKPRRVAAQLAGSTISFDRSFLRQHMRAAHDLLHYRNLDVSTLNEVARRFWPDVYATRPGAGKKPEDAAHRALDDIEASIACLRHYLAQIGPKPRIVHVERFTVAEPIEPGPF
jgi:oligoribonuclease